MKTEPLTLDPKTLATWTCAIRKSSHWSQEALAAACGLDVRTIQRIEAGEPSSISTRRQLARGLGYENQDIFEDPEFFRKLNEILSNTAEAAQAEEIKKHYPDHIKIKIERVKNGDALGRFADLVSASVFQADDAISQEAKENAASLFDYVRDLTDISSDVSFTDKVRFNKELGGMLNELESMGTAVYSGFRHTKITGQNWQDKTPLPLTVGYMMVVPADREIEEILVPRRLSF